MESTEWKIKELPITKELAIYTNTELIAGGLTKANAHLIVSAANACIKLNPDNPMAVAESISDLYEACKAQHEAIDILFALLIGRDRNFFPSKSGKPWDACRQGNEVITKVKGGELRKEVKMINQVIRFQNDIVMVFDENGDQMPEYQGRYDDVKEKILADAPENAEFFHGHQSAFENAVPREEW